MANRSWHLPEGTTVPVRLTIGGHFYILNAVTSGDHLDIPGLPAQALRDLMGSGQVQLDVGNGAVVWTATLYGFSDAVMNAGRTIQAI